MAVAAGRAADPDATAQRVVMVSREFPLLEGGSGAVLLAGLSLSAGTAVSEVLGGAAAVVDQIALAEPGTLVIAADDSAQSAGAGAVLTGTDGAAFDPVVRTSRSLPMVARSGDGRRHVYVDPRLSRDVGARETIGGIEANLGGDATVAVIAGVSAAQLGERFDTGHAAQDASRSAAGVIRLIADSLTSGIDGLVLGFEQATVAVARLRCTGTKPWVVRDEETPRELTKTSVAEGTGIPISLPAYSRAFEPKLYWEAAVFAEGKGIDATPMFPPRRRVDAAGTLVSDYERVAMPRTGSVYTVTTVRVPVPDLPSPYSLAIVALDDSPVRVLLKSTGVPAGTISIGQTGAVVMRRLATRSGVPDYGYAFWPGKTLVDREVSA